LAKGEGALILNTLNRNRQTSSHRMSGFTLIELILVIVILGILSAAAAPAFVDLSGQAEQASADAVLAASRSAASINFAANRVGVTQDLIVDGATLLGALDGTPSGWTASGDTITRTGQDGVVYTIIIGSDESTTAKAVISENW
jgi:MSHA pilin protein MshA